MSVVDFVGRRADLLAYQGPYDQKGDHLYVPALVTGSEGGSLVVGVEKVAQRFLLKLLKEAGSTPYKDDGCLFLVDARSGAWHTVIDIEQSYYSALLDVKRQLNAEETSLDPLDEQFSGALLLGVTLLADLVRLRIQIITLAGQTRLIVPLPVPIR